MNTIKNVFKSKDSLIFLVLAILCLAPFITPAIALFMGLGYALTCCHPYSKESSKVSKYLLQFSVVGLGFGMNLYDSLESGKEGMMFTIISVVSVITLGIIIGKLLKVNRKSAYLISSGTAICGGSAIAAVAPVIKAKDNEILVSMGTIFILNAIALFVFPPIGHYFGLSQEQFGMWAAIAIHDTSSVVGAGAAYGAKALEVATMVKLTRALWIIPISIVTMFIFKQKGSKISIPWFIFFFIIAMCLNTFCNLNSSVGEALTTLAKKGLTITLFLIGTGLSRSVIKSVGIKPMVQGVVLWVFIATISLLVII